jgi:hypothetical protein
VHSEAGIWNFLTVWQIEGAKVMSKTHDFQCLQFFPAKMANAVALVFAQFIQPHTGYS